jgi:hypothetical protein
MVADPFVSALVVVPFEYATQAVVEFVIAPLPLIDILHLTPPLDEPLRVSM